MKTLHVVLLDDHQVVLAGMKDVLEQMSGVSVDATFATSVELVKYLRQDKPDVIITDYNMPMDEVHVDGLKFVTYLLRTFPSVKILVLTMISNQMIISALYDAGVSGVILKQDPISEVLLALNTVRGNKRYYPPSFQRDILHGKNKMPINERIDSLSPREYEVLRYFVTGESISKIAEKLNRSAKTVSLQKNSAMRKLNAETNQELIKFCVENNIFN